MEIAVIIPAYNEASHLGAVLQNLPTSLYGHAVYPLVIDDGSKDKTSEVARAIDGVRVIRHRTNLGKGAAAKTGCDAAYLLGYDIIVLMDGDGQHLPSDLERMVAPLLQEGATSRLVLGSRNFSSQMPLTMRLGNHFLNRVAHLMFGITARDTQSGFRAFARDIYPQIRWVAPHYAMETEMLILATMHQVPYTEIAIETIYQDNYKGTTPLDGLRILKSLIKWKMPWYQESSLLESSSL